MSAEQPSETSQPALPTPTPPNPPSAPPEVTTNPPTTTAPTPTRQSKKKRQTTKFVPAAFLFKDFDPEVDRPLPNDTTQGHNGGYNGVKFQFDLNPLTEEWLKEAIMQKEREREEALRGKPLALYNTGLKELTKRQFEELTDNAKMRACLGILPGTSRSKGLVSFLRNKAEEDVQKDWPGHNLNLHSHSSFLHYPLEQKIMLSYTLTTKLADRSGYPGALSRQFLEETIPDRYKSYQSSHNLWTSIQNNTVTPAAPPSKSLLAPPLGASPSGLIAAGTDGPVEPASSSNQDDTEGSVTTAASQDKLSTNQGSPIAPVPQPSLPHKPTLPPLLHLSPLSLLHSQPIPSQLLLLVIRPSPYHPFKLLTLVTGRPQKDSVKRLPNNQRTSPWAERLDRANRTAAQLSHRRLRKDQAMIGTKTQPSGVKQIGLDGAFTPRRPRDEPTKVMVQYCDRPIKTIRYVPSMTLEVLLVLLDEDDVDGTFVGRLKSQPEYACSPVTEASFKQLVRRCIVKNDTILLWKVQEEDDDIDMDSDTELPDSREESVDTDRGSDEPEMRDAINQNTPDFNQSEPIPVHTPPSRTVESKNDQTKVLNMGMAMSIDSIIDTPKVAPTTAGKGKRATAAAPDPKKVDESQTKAGKQRVARKEKNGPKSQAPSETEPESENTGRQTRLRTSRKAKVPFDNTPPEIVNAVEKQDQIKTARAGRPPAKEKKANKKKDMDALQS
ncbi:hypothetical protein BJ508DRAFT_312122 [Ascobolus immersus RN42]|uniref:Uncharacterized protein n=1 Tax=Ascobolus immersus RN42 TaxID=1160509 RepID=A0A3N4HN88_ASCIM|nr:hypothetical protein BJ508DRAFT_312122 [Ascobolus immersus RN42]